MTILTTRLWVATQRQLLRTWVASHQGTLLAVAWAIVIICLVVI